MVRVSFTCFIVLASIYAHSAYAQDYLDRPVCFTVVNEAPYTVFGDVSTAPDVNDQGQQITHQATFRLKEDETYEMCTTGPMINGDSVRLRTRTLVPTFECVSRVWPGAELIIRGRYEDERSTETWAECL